MNPVKIQNTSHAILKKEIIIITIKIFETPPEIFLIGMKVQRDGGG